MLFCVVGTSGVRRLDDVGLQSPIRESLAAAPFPRINTCPRANESEQILTLLLSSCDAILCWWVWGAEPGMKCKHSNQYYPIDAHGSRDIY